MAQKNEFPMWSPHEKARLFKRYTGEIPVELKDSETMTVEDNRYVFSGKLKWIETTSKEENDEQPIEGLLVPNTYVTIRTNSLKAFAVGDIIELPKSSPLGGLWVIQDGMTTDYAYTPKQVQTYQYLPLSSLG
jgi:hypothetical protein